MIWLTTERVLALFPAGTIVRDPHHRESPESQISFVELRNKPQFITTRECLCKSDFTLGEI